MLQKLVRRHRTAFATGSAVVLALVAGMVTSTVLYLQETAAWKSEAAQRRAAQASAQLAEKETRNAREQMTIAKDYAKAESAARREAEAISAFVKDVFQSPDPERDGRTITVAETLDRAAKKLLDTDLVSQPAVQIKFLETIGWTYLGLGLSDKAVPLFEKSKDYYIATVGPEHPDTVKALFELASSYSLAGRRDEALKLGETVLVLCRKTGGNRTPDAMNALADSYNEVGRQDKALSLREEALEINRKIDGPQDAKTLQAMRGLAVSYFEAKRRDEATKVFEELLLISRKNFGLERPATLTAISDLAVCYFKMGRRKEALKLQSLLPPSFLRSKTA